MTSRGVGDEVWQTYLRAVAEDTPAEVLVRLADHKDPGVRRGVAQNPNTPPEVRTQMVDDEDPYVRLLASMTIRGAGMSRGG